MTTKALRIRDAVVELLTASTCGGVPAERIYLDISHAIEATFPSIAVELGDEIPPQRNTVTRLDRQVIVKVQVISAATTGLGAIDATTSADPVVAEVSRRIMADVSLGGLSFDIQEQDTQRQREETGRSVLMTTLNFSVDFSTSELSREN